MNTSNYLANYLFILIFSIKSVCFYFLLTDHLSKHLFTYAFIYSFFILYSFILTHVVIFLSKYRLPLKSLNKDCQSNHLNRILSLSVCFLVDQTFLFIASAVCIMRLIYNIYI